MAYRHPPSSRRREIEFRRAQRSGNPVVESPSSGPSNDAEVSHRPDKAKRRHFRKQYLRWLWPYRWTLVVIFLLALVSAGLDAGWPLAIREVINQLAGAAPKATKLHRLNFLSVIIMAVLLTRQAVDTFRGYRMTVMNSKAVFRLRRALFERLPNLSLVDLSGLKSGGIVSRLSNDVESASGLIQMAVISPCVAIIRVLITVIVLFVLSWQLAVAALIVLPPLAITSFFWIRRVRPIYRSTQADRTNIDARVNETFGGIRVVRAFRREPHEERSYAVGHHTIIRKRLYAERMEMMLEAVWGILIPLTMLTIVWYGGILYLAGRAQLGDLFAFSLFVTLLLQPVWQIVSSVSQMQKSLAATERVFEGMEMPPDKPDLPGAVDAPQRVDEIRFEQVSFAYRTGTPVVKDFSLQVPGGAVVALVGPSGAGKTTLTDLVARFYDPGEGAILLNGIDLRRLRLRSYRSLLAVVPQEVFLFDGNVRQNIAYGRRDVSDEEVEQAARRANAHRFIDQLPEKYDTLIGERGFKLSGGQRQRLSIARAILADPKILILDEATSNLDTESEQLIQAALAELLKDRTTFVIAHRLSTITHADLIVVMDQGNIIESGNHEDLMARHGLYFDMVERQRQSFGTVLQVP